FAVRAVLRQRRADVRRLVVDELAERILAVPGDTQGGSVALHPRPVVLRVVLQIVWVALGRHVVTSPLVGRSVSSRPGHGAGDRGRRSSAPFRGRTASPRRTPCRSHGRASASASRRSPRRLRGSPCPAAARPAPP